MNELRGNEPEEYKKISKIMNQRMKELANIQATNLPPQLSIMMEGMKRTEAMNIIDEKIGLIQWFLKLLKNDDD